MIDDQFLHGIMAGRNNAKKIQDGEDKGILLVLILPQLAFLVSAILMGIPHTKRFEERLALSNRINVLSFPPGRKLGPKSTRTKG